MDQHDEHSTYVRRRGTPFAIGQDVHIEQGGGALLVARRDMHISRGGGQWLVALGQQHVHQGGGAVLVSREAHVTNSFVGLMIAGRASVDGRARTLARVSLQSAIVTVAAFGLGLLIGRRRAR